MKAIVPTQRSDEDLDDLVALYVDLTRPSARTQQNHDRHWPRWVRWCAEAGIDPLEADAGLVVRYVREAFDDVGAGSYRAYLRAISWRYTEAGLPDPTASPLVERAVAQELEKSSSRPSQVRTTVARILDPDVLVAALGAPAPSGPPRLALLRARLVLGWHLDRFLLDRLDGAGDVVVEPDGDGLWVGEVRLDATGRMSCPVATYQHLLDSGFVPEGDATFAGVHHYEGRGWVRDRPSDVDKLHLAAVRKAASGVRGDGGPRLAIRDRSKAVIDDVDDLERLLVMLDDELWTWWRDDVILSLQFWAGLSAPDLARTIWELIDLSDPDAAVVSLPWRRNVSTPEGSVRAIPQAPNLCGAEVIRRWRWLTKHRLGDTDPVLPARGGFGSGRPPKPIDADDVSAAQKAGEAIKRRLIAIGVDPAGYSSTTCRRTFRHLAEKGGATDAQMALHLGQVNPHPLNRQSAGVVAVRDPMTASNRMTWGDDHG